MLCLLAHYCTYTPTNECDVRVRSMWISTILNFAVADHWYIDIQNLRESFHRHDDSPPGPDLNLTGCLVSFTPCVPVMSHYLDYPSVQIQSVFSFYPLCHARVLLSIFIILKTKQSNTILPPNCVTLFCTSWPYNLSLNNDEDDDEDLHLRKLHTYAFPYAAAWLLCNNNEWVTRFLFLVLQISLGPFNLRYIWTRALHYMNEVTHKLCNRYKHHPYIPGKIINLFDLIFMGL